MMYQNRSKPEGSYNMNRMWKRNLSFLFLGILGFALYYQIAVHKSLPPTEANQPDFPELGDNSEDTVHILLPPGMEVGNKTRSKDSGETSWPHNNDKYNCETNVPCSYANDVDLRIIVMVYNRGQSLQKVLNSLQNLILDGASTALEIWVDRSKLGNLVSEETVKVAKTFKWKHGPTRTHIQKQHVGIYGQWIDTWRPKENSSELALLLEDDVDLSPYAYRWLKAAHDKYKNLHDNVGYSLFEGSIAGLNKPPSSDIAFMYRRMGSQGFAPHPTWWRKFQDWFHSKKRDQKFHPYVKKDPLVTGWYKSFETQNKQDSMWTIWHIFYTDSNNLYTIYPNVGQYMHSKSSSFQSEQYFAFHRREAGLHFNGKGRESDKHLLKTWDEAYIQFPEKLRRHDYNGRILS